MAEELHSNQHHEDIGFEREDMGARNVYAFLIALALMGVLVHFVVKGIYSFMDSYEKAHQPPANPLATATETARAPGKEIGRASCRERARKGESAAGLIRKAIE